MVPLKGRRPSKDDLFQEPEILCMRWLLFTQQRLAVIGGNAGKLTLKIFFNLSGANFQINDIFHSFPIL